MQPARHARRVPKLRREGQGQASQGRIMVGRDDSPIYYKYLKLPYFPREFTNLNDL